jgi:hypothetical protein
LETDIPGSRSEVVASMQEIYAETFEDYTTREKRQSPEYEDLANRMAQANEIVDAGERRAVVKELMSEFGDLATSNAAAQQVFEDLRHGVYEHFETQMAVWDHQAEQEGMSLEDRARLAHMMREEKKLFVRDLMPDTHSVEVLQLRDLALYGNSTGPSFDALISAQEDKGKTLDEAFLHVIESSRRANQDVSNAGKGSKE